MTDNDHSATYLQMSSRSDLFQEQAKFNELKKMEGKWQACQSELEALKVKYLLQSELGGLLHSL